MQERIQKSSAWNPPSPTKSSQFAPRPYAVKATQDAHQPPTHEAIEQETSNQNRSEGFRLQLKEKHGTITPVEQERLGVLQAKMDDARKKRLARAKAQPNLLEILIRNAETSQAAEPTAPVQPKLKIGQPNDEYEQEADRVASRVVEQIHTPAAAQSTQGEADSRPEVQEAKLQTKPSISDLQRSPLAPVSRQEAKPAPATLQAKSTLQLGINGGEALTALESERTSARSIGKPLELILPTQMGQVKRADSSGVRAQPEAQSDRLHQSIQAKAFTTGQGLKADDLTKVVQEKGQAVNPPSAAKDCKGSTPTQTVVQRTLTVDNQPVNDPSNVPAPQGVNAEVFKQAIAKLIRSSATINLTQDDLPKLAALLNGKEDVGNSTAALNAYAKIVIGDNVKVGSRLQMLLRPPNLRALGNYFTKNPNLAGRVRIDFTSQTTVDNNYGGGVYNRTGNKRIEIGGSVANEANPLYFLRTVIHETGHATFQQMLVIGELTNETNKGTIWAQLTACHKQVKDLEWQMKKGLSSAVGNYDWVAGKKQELKEARATRDKMVNKLRSDAATLTKHGKEFYDAWLILRRENGQYMLGLPLTDQADHPMKSPSGRQKYMAESFTEFCAETFMYMAMHRQDLKSHVRQLHEDQKVPKQVKEAWIDVIRVLERCEEKIIHTRPWERKRASQGGQRQHLI
ncbi:MAG: hypothetical protein F6J95_025755 [Leptolyngbya sp. SIO1E4]|nr:hypothetical protein [Leptolyngbya sp. SIO1E4]